MQEDNASLQAELDRMQKAIRIAGMELQQLRYATHCLSIYCGLTAALLSAYGRPSPSQSDLL